MAEKSCFEKILVDIRRVDAMRDTLLSEAFSALEIMQSNLASMLLLNVGDRHLAERWMSTHRRAFGGRTAYEMLVDGELDVVWEKVSSEGREFDSIELGS
ncbi:hypothetical protein GCM10007898_44130 [Dyella flagellata]|uniref:Antitoxin Xre/MbcA/ParS-like toxin-binding domain-containing protein n=2 Tax=Dyella flagellata TaxID=1867833 RepID=A0ABQ5XHK1_9GAMM|nr:hypothetical protein GCM10007898_44130 [Dyella flagellata]